MRIDFRKIIIDFLKHSLYQSTFDIPSSIINSLLSYLINYINNEITFVSFPSFIFICLMTYLYSIYFIKCRIYIIQYDRINFTIENAKNTLPLLYESIYLRIIQYSLTQFELTKYVGNSIILLLLPVRFRFSIIYN